MSDPILPRPHLIIFDMDGTLTRPILNFDRMREEIGVVDEPLLEAIEKMGHQERSRAMSILHRHEEEAAAASELQPDVHEVLNALRQPGIPLVLMTRNSRLSVASFLARHELSFELIRTRDDGPCKPSPEPVFDICRHFKVEASETWVIGDYLYDIQCGAAAGSSTILLLEKQFDRPSWADQADLVISGLKELLQHGGFEACLDRSLA